MIINENSIPSRLIICDAAAKEWKNIKKMKEPKIDDIIKKYLAMPLKMQKYFWSTASSQQKPQKFLNNASVQKQAANSKVAIKKKIKELEVAYNFTNDLQLQEEQVVIRYDEPDKLSILFQNPELLDHIHNLVEYGSANACRTHYHPVWIAVAARQFACAFSNVSIIIFQDDKAKIDLGIPAVGRTQKLISSVYLMIKPNKENDDLQTEQYSKALKINNEIKPIWVLLVNGGPNENPRYFKNIESYCKLFKKFDLDYLTVRTHAPGQSKYNPVERSIATLLGKLAGIVLLIDHFEKHLDSQ
ncbi:3370_t:CDS:2, partial [Gigaspora margarita]